MQMSLHDANPYVSRFVSAFFGRFRSSVERRADLIYRFYCAPVTERSEITGINSARISSSSMIS
jgi:hypothetical protein